MASVRRQSVRARSGHQRNTLSRAVAATVERLEGRVLLSTIYQATMDVNPGWTASGQWAYGIPAGQGGTAHGYPDPTAGYTGSNVYGVNLSGDYSTIAGGPYYLTTQAINCSGYTGVQLQYRRWLNSDYGPFVVDTVDVSNNGTTWTNLYTNSTATQVAENTWTLQTHDIGASADNQATVYIRWGYQTGSAAFAYSGWNLDDVMVTGTATGVGPFNPNPITIPDSGSASPYPSTINISGLSGTITDLNVTVKGLSHSYPDDIDLLLVGPAGQKAILMSDVGGNADAVNLTLTFDDEAAISLPDSDPLFSGSYKPTDINLGDTFNSPAPAGPYTALLSAFDGTNPNGTWSLYVLDDAGGDSGQIANGWELNITTGGVSQGEIHGSKWNDLDGDGLWDSGEPGLPNWRIYLDANTNGQWDSGEASTLTDSSGNYAFTGLAAGTYYVGEAMPSGWTQTFPGAAGQLTSTGAATAVDLSNITTTGGNDLHYLQGERIGDEVPIGSLVHAQTNVSGPLINLNAFRADPRFASINGSGYAAVIIDTGIDLDHPFFGPDLDHNGVADRIIYSYDFSGSNDPDATDTNGHGSNVSSIVASSDPTYPGMAPGVNIIHLKVFPDGSSSAYSSDIEEALQWVAANAATYHILSVNMSLGSGNYNAPTTSVYSDEIQAITNAGVIVVCAAGNSFYQYGGAQGVAQPAADPNSVAVSAVWDGNNGSGYYWSSGAIDYTTGADRITSFSQRSGTMTGIMAPGAMIYGAGATGGITEYAGTSQASPHIAGIAVLAQQLAISRLGRRLTLSEFRSLLNSTGVTINDGDNEDDNVVNTGLNFKRVDVLALGNAIYNMGSTTVPYHHTVTVGAGQVVTGKNFGNRADLPAVTLSLTGSPMAEAGGVATVTATLSVAATSTVTVNLGFSGLATYGSDYSASTNQLLIPAGSLSASLTLTALQDALVEGNETIIVDITGVTNAIESGTQQVTATITDDDAAPASISGIFWSDGDSDGVRDSGENILPNWEVYLDANNNGQWDAGEAKTTTSANGAYSFIDLAPGTYHVREILQSGWTQTYPTSGSGTGVIGLDAVHYQWPSNPFATNVDFDTFRAALTAAGYTIVPVTSFTASGLSGLDAVFLTQSYVGGSSYSSSDIQAIHDFVAAGGGAVVMADAGDTFNTLNMNALVASWGVSFSSTATDGSGYTITNFIAHAVTAGVSMLGVDYQRPQIINAPALDLTVNGGSDNMLSVVDGTGGAGNVAMLSDSSLWADADTPGLDRPITFGDNLRLLQNLLAYVVGSSSGGAGAHIVTLTAGQSVSGADFGNHRNNSGPTGIDLSSRSVAENQPSGTVVGTFSTFDVDPNDTFTYELVSGPGGSGPDNDSFQIVGNELRTAAIFDYETKSSYSIWVRSTDAGGLWVEAAMTITVTDVTETPVGPAAPVITGMSDDTGASATDRITSDTRLLYSGTADAFVIVRVFRDGTLAGTTMSDSWGFWTFDDQSTALADGPHTIVAQAVDNWTGLGSELSPQFIVMVDTVAPAQPGRPSLDPSTDSGTSDSDGITSAPNPTVLLGQLSSYFAWDLYDYTKHPDGSKYFYERDGATGAVIRRFEVPWMQVWEYYGSGASYIPQSMAADGQTIYMLFIGNGNTMNSIVRMRRSDGAVLDILPVQATLLGGMAYLNGSLYIAADKSLLRVDPSTGTVLQTVPTALQFVPNGGAVSYELSALPERGTLLYSTWATLTEINPATGVVVRQVDLALSDPLWYVGTSSVSYVGHDRVLCYIYDSRLPNYQNAGRALVDLNTGLPIWSALETDLGWTWVISGEGDAESPFHRVFVDGVQVGGDYISAPELQLPVLSDGQHTIVIQSLDAAGNISAVSDPLTILIDTVDLTTPPAIPVLDPTSDTGVSSTDGITSASELVFHNDGDAALRYQLFVDDQASGPVVFGGTMVSVGGLGEGRHEVIWRQTNLAGDYSPASPARVLWIDRTAPVQPGQPALDPASDTGTSNTDGITSITSPTIILGHLGSYFAWEIYSNQPSSSNYLAERDGATGALIRKIDIPWQEVTDDYLPAANGIPQSLAADDQTIYVLFSQGTDNRLVRLRRSDGSLIDILPMPVQRLGGMAYLNGSLYIVADKSLLRVDPATGTVLQTVLTEMQFLGEAGSTSYELSAIPERGTLLFVSWISAIEVDPATGAAVQSKTLAIGDPYWSVGISSASYLGHDRVLCYIDDTRQTSAPYFGRALMDLATGQTIWATLETDLSWIWVSTGEGDAESPYYRIFVDGVQTGSNYISAQQFQLPTLSEGQHTVVIQSVDAAGNVSATSGALTITIDTVRPQITSATVNAGQAQRSMVKRLDVTFSEPVILSSNAITVRKSDGTIIPNTTVTFSNPSGDKKTYIVAFGGTGVIGGSLADGIYDLIVSAASVQDTAGNVLTGDYSQRFHRLFGDSDGNRIINSLDYARLKQTFGRAPTDPLFNTAFDYEGNGLINALDLARFRQRYGMSYSY